jgi:hypothetical protein
VAASSWLVALNPTKDEAGGSKSKNIKKKQIMKIVMFKCTHSRFLKTSKLMIFHLCCDMQL